MSDTIRIDRKVFDEPPESFEHSADITVENCRQDAEDLLRLLGLWQDYGRFHASFVEGEDGEPDRLHIWVGETRYDKLAEKYRQELGVAHRLQAELNAMKNKTKTLLDGTANRMRNTSDLREENARLRNALHALTQPDEVRSEG